MATARGARCLKTDPSSLTRVRLIASTPLPITTAGSSTRHAGPSPLGIWSPFPILTTSGRRTRWSVAPSALRPRTLCAAARAASLPMRPTACCAPTLSAWASLCQAPPSTRRATAGCATECAATSATRAARSPMSRARSCWSERLSCLRSFCPSRAQRIKGM